jgi:hypothetical protein
MPHLILKIIVLKFIVVHILSIDLYRLYNIGFVLGVVFMIQILSGILLSMTCSVLVFPFF